jgi:hypothetical protein
VIDRTGSGNAPELGCVHLQSAVGQASKTRNSPAWPRIGTPCRESRRLAQHGIGTVAELADADLAVLVSEVGPRMGSWYAGVDGDHRWRVVTEVQLSLADLREGLYRRSPSARVGAVPTGTSTGRSTVTSD